MRRIWISIAIAGLLTVMLSIVTYNEIKQIRKSPHRDAFINAINKGGPLGYLYRFLLLRKGTDLYYAAIIPWLYSGQAQLEDTPTNRYILEQHLKTIPKNLAYEYLASYPLPLTSSGEFRPLFVGALERNNHAVIYKLKNSEEGREFLRAWIRDSIIARRNFTLFQTLFPALLEFEGLEITAMLDLFADDLVKCASHGCTETLEDPEALAHAMSGKVAARSILKWVIKALSIKQLTVPAATPFFTAFVRMEETSEVAADFLLRAEYLFSPSAILQMLLPNHCLEEVDYFCTMPKFVSPRLVKMLLATFTNDPFRWLAVFHALIHNSDNMQAIEISGPLLKGPDSTIKKGVIVLLARHSYRLPLFDLDDAFKGGARRPLLFLDDEQYVSSEAFQTYENLSGHGYRHVGKRFPPYLGRRVRIEDIDDWKAFIAKFPWFPATDDAYYRLAYLQFITGDLRGADSTVGEYKRRDLVDNDIKPYMVLLEDVLIAASPSGPLPRTETIISKLDALPWVYWPSQMHILRQDYRSLELLTFAIDWVLMREGSGAFDLADREILYGARSELDSVRARCTNSGFEDCLLATPLKHYESIISQRLDLLASPNPEFDKTLIAVLVGAQ